MEITPIGGVLILLGAVFFFARPGLLYWCAIFFLPFSATAVVNVGSNDSFSGLQAWMFFGTLWLAHEAAGIATIKNRWYKSQTRASVRRLLIFLLIALFSLVMPLWINGRLSIQSATLTSSEAMPLFFRLQHVTQFLYLAYGVLFAIFVAVKNFNFGEFRRTVSIFLSSSVFVSSWGLLQWFCYQVRVQYPAFLFNTNKHEAAMGYLAEYSDLGVTRVSSVTTEPSMLAQYLLIVLIFAVFAVLGKQAVISKFWDRIALVLAVLLLLLTTSSTAYLFLALLIPVFLAYLLLLGRLRRWHIVSLMLLLVASAVVYSKSIIVQDLADTAIFSKLESYSGLERLNSVAMAWGYFLRYPVLGVGWGSVTSHDLIFKLLANTGIAGLIAFAVFLKSMVSGLWSSVADIRTRMGVPERSYWASCLLIASLILILTNVFTEFAFVYGHLWFVFGMSLAIPLGRDMRSSACLAGVQQVRA